MNLWARSYKQGFTIVELLVVIVVISILASITVVAFNGVQQRAIEAVARADLKANHTKILEYQILNGTYPTSANNGKRQVILATGCTPGSVSSTGVYCPIVSNDNLYVNYTPPGSGVSSFTLLMGSGTRGHAIELDGTVKSMTCSVASGVPPYPGYTTVYECPMTTTSSQRNYYSQ
jgi:prepilin-type N-terminal cleavage/methylation domain-containing protein